jgi:hypothetical protein
MVDYVLEFFSKLMDVILAILGIMLSFVAKIFKKF